MSNLLLPIQFGQLPGGASYCFTTWAQFGLDMANAMEAVLENGRAFYNYGDTKPAPEYQDYPWLRTVDGRWYEYDGSWISPNNYDANERRLYVGTEVQLKTYDGGDAGAASDRSGPMWEVDAEFSDRVPIGVGTHAANPEDNAGSDTHTLTEAEGAVGVHTHPFGLTNAGNDDAFFARSGVNTVQGWTGYYITGSNGNVVSGQTTADLFTLPSGTGGAGVGTPAAFSLLQKVRGVYVIKPSGRLYFRVV